MLKIAITGPESTGKTTLAKALAKNFSAVWLEEYARAYLTELDGSYEVQDILDIAKGQIRSEDQLLKTKKAPLLFSDTELLVCKVWLEYKYDLNDPWIDSTFKQRHYDLFLLCNIDLPWEEDPLREHEGTSDRAAIFQLYYDHLLAVGKNFMVIEGQGDERLQQAIAAVENLISTAAKPKILF
jgi:NadR type nicotinamide-nucleotide adenylyltransferase